MSSIFGPRLDNMLPCDAPTNLDSVSSILSVPDDDTMWESWPQAAFALPQQITHKTQSALSISPMSSMVSSQSSTCSKARSKSSDLLDDHEVLSFLASLDMKIRQLECSASNKNINANVLRVHNLLLDMDSIHSYVGFSQDERDRLEVLYLQAQSDQCDLLVDILEYLLDVNTSIIQRRSFIVGPSSSSPSSLPTIYDAWMSTNVHTSITSI